MYIFSKKNLAGVKVQKLELFVNFKKFCSCKMKQKIPLDANNS